MMCVTFLGTVLAFVIAGVLYMVGGLAMCVLTVGGLELGWGVVCYFWIPRVLRQLHEEVNTFLNIFLLYFSNVMY